MHSNHVQGRRKTRAHGEVDLGTINMLRQQKDWVGGSRKWSVFMTFRAMLK